MGRVAGSPWDGSLGGYSIRLVISRKAWVRGVAGSSRDGGLSGHSI